MTLSIHHIAINATAPDAIAALYQNAVGFSPVGIFDGAHWIAAPNGFIALYPVSESASPPRRVFDQGIGHFCIQSGGGGDAAWQKLDAAGIVFNAPPAGLGTGVMYAYGRDPEGNLIETEGVTDESVETPPWIAHVALVSANLDRLADFYAQLIGRVSHREGSFAHPSFRQITGFDDVKVSAKWIMADNMVFEMWCYLNPATRPSQAPADGMAGYRHTGFCCNDLGAEITRLAVAGIAVSGCDPVHGAAALEGRDPDGNRFLVLETSQNRHPLSLAGLARPAMVSDRLIEKDHS